MDNLGDPMPQPELAPEPEPQPEPEPEPQPLAPPFSQVALEALGPVRRLAWTPGRDCPAELLALAAQLDQPTAAAPLVNDLALLEMVRIARERRHALRVDEAVWLWLAPARDMRERVHLLETRMPEGPASPLLTALVTLPLRTYQGEGALYAACAGRSVLADDAGLGRTVQAVAALRLLAAQFGAERALVLAPAERLAHWAEQWQALTGLSALQAGSVTDITAAAQAEASPQAPLLLLAEAALAVQADTLAALQAFAPDSVVVDESDDANLSPWLDTDFAAALATLDGPFALSVARTPVEVRPRALRAMLEWVDASCLGAIGRLEALAEAPVAERLEALGPWLLRRTKTLVLRQLPETVEAICPVELDAAERPLHDARLAQIVRAVQRWQRSRYLSDADQRRLLSTLHALRLGCNAGKIGTTIEGLETLLAEPDMRVVVFSQWVDSLEALSAALTERGIAHLALPVDVGGEARRALVSAFQQDPQQRVLLCCDDSPGGQLGLRHAATAILHLDRPWNPALLAQRFSRVHRADRVRQVPVCHLVASDTLEERLVRAQDDEASREHFVGLIDGAQAEAFLGGARLERFMTALSVLVGVPA
ncbi:SNF2-related protein [Sphaerotilus natans]|uniref:SNF2-related protein n=1 Tax=Sphaerotilus natans TaxID=34103 RepID=UPI0011159ED3|nr:DEAD/DEAH box helicase [Sphaerotilus natans]